MDYKDPSLEQEILESFEKKLSKRSRITGKLLITPREILHDFKQALQRVKED